MCGRCIVGFFVRLYNGSTDRIIEWVKNKGGIATASYHINVPKDFEGYTLGTRLDWPLSTYTASETDFSPSKAATPGTKENGYYLSTPHSSALFFIRGGWVRLALTILSYVTQDVV